MTGAELTGFVPHRPVRPEKSEGGIRFKLVSEYQPAGDQRTAIADFKTAKFLYPSMAQGSPEATEPAGSSYGKGNGQGIGTSQGNGNGHTK